MDQHTTQPVATTFLASTHAKIMSDNSVFNDEKQFESAVYLPQAYDYLPHTNWHRLAMIRVGRILTKVKIQKVKYQDTMKLY